MTTISVLRWQYRIRRLQGRSVITAAVLAIYDTARPAPFLPLLDAAITAIHRFTEHDSLLKTKEELDEYYGYEEDEKDDENE